MFYDNYVLYSLQFGVYNILCIYTKTLKRKKATNLTFPIRWLIALLGVTFTTQTPIRYASKETPPRSRNSSVAHDETSANEWYLGQDYVEGKLDCVDRN